MTKSTKLQFRCYRCETVNDYPAIKDESVEEGSIILKRCTMCAAFNEITLPKHYKSTPQILLRGMKPDE